MSAPEHRVPEVPKFALALNRRAMAEIPLPTVGVDRMAALHPRLAVALVLVEGMSYKEGQGVLEIPIGAVTGRLS
jgi:hypothetical protein